MVQGTRETGQSASSMLVIQASRFEFEPENSHKKPGVAFAKVYSFSAREVETESLSDLVSKQGGQLLRISIQSCPLVSVYVCTCSNVECTHTHKYELNKDGLF